MVLTKYVDPPVIMTPSQLIRRPKIFLYGGFATGSIPDTVAMGVVYVLSLPSFHWQKQNYNPTYGRCRHSCNLVGNRQMVVVGGIVVDPNFLPNATDPSGTYSCI